MLLILTRQVVENLEQMDFRYFLIPDEKEKLMAIDGCILLVPLKEDQIKNVPGERRQSLVHIQSSIIDKMIKGAEMNCFIDEKDFL